jgi:tetratricopeptide (TPR) repeat protein
MHLMLAGLCLLPLFFACAPQVRRETTVPPPLGVQPLPPLQLEGLDKKIDSLRGLLETKDLNEEETAVARDLLTTYETVREVLSYPLFADDYHRIVDLLYGNLTRLNEEHLKTVRRLGMQSTQAHFEKRRAILNDYLSGKYLSAIEACAELEKELGPGGLTSDISLLYALSLGENGRYEEALQISEAISPELEKEPGFILLRLKSMEWELALGKQDEASKDYEQLAARLRDVEALLKSAEKRGIPEPSKVSTEESPGSEVATVETEAPAPMTTEEVLKKADELVKGGEREKAEFLLYQHRLRLEEGPEAEAVDRALENLENGAVVSSPPPEPEGPTAGEILKMASAFIDGEKYEEALLKLHELKEKQPLGPEAQKLEARAIEKIIIRERNKAAELFLRARNAAEPEKKAELLKSSYDILKAVAEKYPDSPLNKKINDNMRAIENELKKIKRMG